ncbi:MAG TPA: CPBP family intramembrane glutamic endopeptidase [Acidimicrobiales bacterium]|nr:CPBP family intramembrane glutamic endopeptidase [Acidimicrobiales bacterium]
MADTGTEPSVDAATAPGWGLLDAVGAYAVAIVASTITAGLAMAITGDSRSVGTTVAGTVGLWIGFAGVPAVVVGLRHLGSLAGALRLRARAVDVPVGVVAGAVSSWVLVRLVYALLLLTGLMHQQQLDRLDDPARNLFSRATGPGIVAIVLVVVVGAPIVEELFFRGFLQRALVARVGTLWGIVLTAVVFALTHFEALQFAGLVAFGVVLGVLAHRSERLGPGIVAHMTFNAITVAILLATR